MSLKTLSNQVVALAGIAQASYLVQQLATCGSADQDAMQASVESILKLDADSVGDVYGGLKGVRVGLQQLNDQLGSTDIHNPESARYSAAIVFLEKQLSNNPDMLAKIHSGIETAQLQSEHFGTLHENILASLGDLYHSTISNLQPRIMVNGDPAYLARPDIVNKIRTLLLAGIRSAMLWRQCGGTRWKFLFYRRRLYAETQRLLALLDKL